MATVEVTREEQQVLDAMRASPELKVAFQALVAVAQSGELTAKPTANVTAASTVLPEPKKASKVSTSEMPAPTPEDWFAAIAYARLDGGRQPKGCEGLFAFTNKDKTVVGSFDGSVGVDRDAHYDHDGGLGVGAARFGPPRT